MNESPCQPHLIARHRDMLGRYGFGLFPVPPYRESKLGDWRVVRHLPSLADGYASAAILEPSRFVLYHRRSAWMSTGLMEQESHAFHVHQAKGIVVAAGLGLGMFAFATSLKPEVERVIVVERDAGVIAIMKEAAGYERWPSNDKVLILQADALAPDLADQMVAIIGNQQPDYLFADIWPACAAPNAATETAAMVGMLMPKAAGWWGQELAFGLWCEAEGRPPDESALEEYAVLAGVPLALTRGYARFCADVIATSLPTAARWNVLGRLLRSLRVAPALKRRSG